MQVTIPIYQRRAGHALMWTTVGLGELTKTRTLGSEVKLKRWLGDELKREAASQSPHAVAALFGPASARLKRVRLEISFKKRGRKKKTGLFPIVLDPRWRTPEERILLAYHPLRQGDALVIDDEATLESQLGSHFATCWKDLDEETLEGLVSDGRDVLRAVAFTVKPKSLLDEARGRKSPWDDLKIDGRREKAKKKKKKGQPPILRRLGVDLTERAAGEALELGRPREPLRSQLQQLLCVPRKGPIVLLGPPGVGKRTALRRAIADLLVWEGYEAHRNLDLVTHVYGLTGSRVIAGMSYLGEWEQRCVEILESVRGRRVLVWFEDLHTLGRVGRSRDSERSVADFFRGPLDRSEIVLLGTATPSQWHRLEEDAPAFASAFTTLRVDPTDEGETLRMMLHEARRIETDNDCAFQPDVFRGVLDLGAPLLADQALPGKALDLLHMLARTAAGSVTFDQLLDTLAEKTGLYADLLDTSDELERDEVLDTLRAEVMGQPRATEAVADLVLRIRAGLTDPRRPFGTYLFTGPTGTGKTQLAKALASYLYGALPGGSRTDRLVRFDMGELSGPDAVRRLIGDRWSPRGMLTEAVKQQPFCVVLLDEIEKAHRSVLYLLLQLLDDGRLTDAAGDRVDFTRCVIVMTSNLGARPRPPMGFDPDEASAIAADVSKAVREFFPPELFNRIERIVPFEPLSDETAKAIAEKELAELLGRRGLTERNVFVFAHTSAVDRMAKEAFDARAGARSVKRYLETHIGALLAEHIASTLRPEMEIIRLYDTDDEYRLTSDALREAEPMEGDFTLEPLIHAPAPRIAAALPAVSKRLEELTTDGSLEALADRLRTHLDKAGESPDDADAVFYLDALRSEIASFREHVEAFVRAGEIAKEQELELSALPHRTPREIGSRTRRLLDRRWFQTPMPRQDRREMLAALAEMAFLERALDESVESGHEVMVELLRVGRGRSAARLGLLDVLAKFYAEWRGSVVEMAGRFRDDVIEEGDDLVPMLNRMPSHVVLRLSGVDVLQWLGGETGCHVWNAVTRGSEVVRVRVVPAQGSCSQFLERHLADRSAFERALEEGHAELPADPERLLPVVRRVRFDPPRRGNVAVPFEIEDYPLQHVERGNARTLQETLPPLLWLRMSHRPEGSR